ncbi:putative 57 kDa heat shock protein [Ricinus communis]|uniref:putative 57 kDa heat shock protein n=1 Tax=Ricinus communis TaxID=3988 RepID=UPI00201A8F42|nr:putative 57 kDa heat shock protein [Ricinus communis]
MEDTDVLNILTPHSSDGFYASNNQFQWSGRKGFVEFKILKYHGLYLRMDLPGVSKDLFSYSLGEDKKSVSFEGEAPKRSPNEEDGRGCYASSFSLSCNCCEISKVKADVGDGVVRKIFRKVQVNNLEGKPCLNGGLVLV